MAKADIEAVIAELWREQPHQPQQRLFTILDGARDERIYHELLHCDAAHRCLYRGELDDDLAEAAPYLVQLRRDSPFTLWLLTHGWGDAWGVFLASEADIDVLRRHFRRFLMVYDESGKPLYFRYYDPRVLRVYLPTCNAEELTTVFGPVTRFYVEGESPQQMLQFTFQRQQLGQQVVDLGSSDGGGIEPAIGQPG